MFYWWVGWQEIFKQIISCPKLLVWDDPANSFSKHDFLSLQSMEIESLPPLPQTKQAIHLLLWDIVFRTNVQANTGWHCRLTIKKGLDFCLNKEILGRPFRFVLYLNVSLGFIHSSTVYMHFLSDWKLYVWVWDWILGVFIGKMGKKPGKIMNGDERMEILPSFHLHQWGWKNAKCNSSD